MTWIDGKWICDKRADLVMRMADKLTDIAPEQVDLDQSLEIADQLLKMVERAINRDPRGGVKP